MNPEEKAARIAARTVVSQENHAEFVANGGKLPAVKSPAEIADPEGAETPPVEETPEKKSPGWLKDLQKERDRRKEAERRAEQTASEMQALRDRVAKMEAGPAPTSDDPEPVRSMFATQEDFEAARLDWKVDQKLHEKEVEAIRAEQQAVAAEIEENWKANFEQFRDANENFETQISACRIQFPRELLGEIPLLDNGPAVMFYLTDPVNVEEAQKLVESFRKDLRIRRFPSAGIRMLARIDDKAAKPASGETRKPAAGKPNGAARETPAIELSKAPAPTESLRGAAMARADPSKMTFDQYRSYRRAQISGKSH